MDEIEAREQVATRVNDKRSFHRHLLIYVTINVVLWAIWAVVGFAIRWWGTRGRSTARRGR
jgi:hypothetical protein